MHLHDLVDKKSSVLTVDDGIVPGRRVFDGELSLGVVFPAKPGSMIQIPRASRYPEFDGPDDPGWTLWSDAPEGQAGVLEVTWDNPSGATTRRFAPSASGTRVVLPTLLDLPDPFAEATLTLRCLGQRAPLFLCTSRRTPRQALYRLARGVGVEIGPGPRPQILPAADVRVSYVEETGPEAWAQLYRADASSKAWALPGYVIGKAHQLPVEDHSLDFIFSSHVLEHLFNPLGHFAHWRQKLKPGGVVLGVVPAADGTKDHVRPRRSMADLIREFETGDFDVPTWAYERWLNELSPRGKDHLDRARAMKAEGVSIHVHCYDEVSVRTLLSHCVAHLGFDAHRIHYRRGSKDFAFVLRASGTGA